MGWCFEQKPANVKQYFQGYVHYEDDHIRIRALDIALKLNAAYIAIEEIDKQNQSRRVYAMVVLLKYVRGDDLDFGTKWISEEAGPVENDCPERILDALTDTDNQNANEWRMRCRHAIACRMPPVGTKVKFDQALPFQNGAWECEFTIVKARRQKLAQAPSGRLYRIGKYFWENSSWHAVEASA